VTFSPQVKFRYDITKKIAGGLEYCAGNGSLKGFDALGQQQQQFFPAIGVDFGPQVGVRDRSQHRGDTLDRPSHREMHTGRRFSRRRATVAKMRPE
jgi:hypothetical protein